MGGFYPRECLAFVRMRIALPLPYAEKIQADGGVWIGEDSGDPARDPGRGDAKLLTQFPGQGALQGFARFHLSARKFPVTRIDLAWRTAGQKYPAIGLDQDSGNNFEGHGHGQADNLNRLPGREAAKEEYYLRQASQAVLMRRTQKSRL